LEEAIAKAGGLIDQQSDPQGVFLFRAEPVALARQLDPTFPIKLGQSTVNVVYRINLRDTNTYFIARKFPVRNKDMVYIASAFISDFGKFLNIISGTANLTYTASGGRF
jgi:polysaccharide export outer membrane protein